MSKYFQVSLCVWLGLYGESVTKARAARILNVSRGTIYRMLRDNRLQTEANGGVAVRSLFAYWYGKKCTLTIG